MTVASSIGRYGNPAISSYVIDADGYYVATDVEAALAEIYETKNPMNRGIESGLTVSDDGGLNISWTAGVVFDPTTGGLVAVNAGNDVVVDDDVNFLIWSLGAMTITGVEPTSTEVLVAIICAAGTDIMHLAQMSTLGSRESDIAWALAEIFPTVIETGLVVSEDPNVVNAFDVVMSAGTMYLDMQSEYDVTVAVYSRVTNLVRHYHAAGAWTTDANAEIDVNNYDNGVNRVAIPANRWAKSMFIFAGGRIHWVYATTHYPNAAQAIGGDLPGIPPGLERCPKLTAVVCQQGSAAFPAAGSDNWIDVRPIVGMNYEGTVSDHGSLAGLGDDDHTQYLLASGARALTGAWAVGGFAISGITNLSAAGELDLTGSNVHMIDINPSRAGTQDVISIVPTSSLAGAGTVWKGIHMDGAALDPGVANIDIYGMHIDLTGVDMTNNPDVWGINIQLPGAYGTGTEIAGYFAGDGRTVEICNDTYAIQASGAVDVTGDITVSGSVDGIDISAISLSNMPAAASGNIDCGAQAITNVGNVDGVDVSAIVAFTTITGITNDVIADGLTDILTLASGNAILTIVGTAATDTITFTIVEAQINHDNIGGVSADDHHAQSHTIVSHSDATLADPGADQIVFWDDSDSKFEFLVANTGLSIVGNNLNCDITQYTDALARTAVVSDAVYGAGWDAVTTIAPSKNTVYDKINAMDTLIAANTTPAEAVAAVIAEDPLALTNALNIGSIVAGVADYDKFLVSDAGLVKFRTGAEVLSDIGASASGHLHNTQTLLCDGINSDGGGFTFSTTGAITFNNALAGITTFSAGTATFEVAADGYITTYPDMAVGADNYVLTYDHALGTIKLEVLPAAGPHTLISHTDVSLADPGADQIVFWDDSDSQFEFLVANTGLSIAGNNLNCDITQYTNAMALAHIVGQNPLALTNGLTVGGSLTITTNLTVGSGEIMQDGIGGYMALWSTNAWNNGAFFKIYDSATGFQFVYDGAEIGSLSSVGNLQIDGDLTVSGDRVSIGRAITAFGTMEPMLDIFGASGTTTGPHITCTIDDADDNPCFSILNYAHDNINMMFDAHFNGANWISGDAGSNFGIVKGNVALAGAADRLNFVCDSGIAVDGNITWNVGGYMDVSGNWVLLGDLTVSGHNIGLGTTPVAASAITTTSTNSTIVRAPYASYYLWYQDDTLNTELIMHAWHATYSDYMKFHAPSTTLVGPTLWVCRGANYNLMLRSSADAELMTITSTGDMILAGDVTVKGNDIKDSGGNIMISFDGASEIDALGYLDISKFTTNASKAYFDMEYDHTATANGSYYNTGYNVSMQPVVNTGVSDTGYERGFFASILPVSAQTGTLKWLYGIGVQVGGYTGCGMTLTNVYGFHCAPYHIAGTITNYYGFYHAIPAQTATVTNSFGVYIRMPAAYAALGNEAAGYFSGDGRSVWICETNYALNVSGAMNLVGAITGVTNLTITGTIATPTTITTSGNITCGGDVRVNGNDIKDSGGATRITLGSTITIGGHLRVSGQDIRCDSVAAQLRSNAGGTNKVTMVYASSEADFTANCSGSSSISAHHIYYDVITASSSERIKSGIVELDYMALAKQLDNVRPKEFYRRESKVKEIGFIAEDLPRMVQCRNEKGEVVGYDTIAFITSLYSKILSQDKAMLKLKERLERLEDAS